MFSKISKAPFPPILIFSEIWARTIFQNYVTKTEFASKSIYVDMRYLELGGHSKTLTCCGRAWKYEGRETLHMLFFSFFSYDTDCFVSVLCHKFSIFIGAQR